MNLEAYQRNLARILYPTIFEERRACANKVTELYAEITGYKQLVSWISYRKQQSSEIIDNDELKLIIIRQLGENASKVSTIPDKKFKLVDTEHLKQWLEINPVNKRKYVPDFHDCNTFATILKGDLDKWDSELCTGEVYVVTERGGHALNVVVDTKRNVWLLEPQTDRLFKMPENWRVYSKLDF